jgi:hypothetical protein
MSTASPPSAWFDSEVDPLVPPPEGGLAEWNRRFSDTWRRSWRSLGAIFAVTFAGPHVAAAVVLDQFTAGAGTLTNLSLLTTDGVAMLAATPGLIGLMLAVTLATLFLSALGWAAGIWAVTQAAMGLPVTMGTALQAGMRRVWAMTGWYLLFMMMVGVGLLACVLPGVYLAAAAALFSFVVVYERGRNPIGRSFLLVHRAFGAAVGRILLLFLVMVVAGGAITMFSYGAGIAATETSPGNPVAVAVVDAAVTVPVNIAVLVGLLLTYTQVRAREEQLTTGALWTAANPE